MISKAKRTHIFKALFTKARAEQKHFCVTLANGEHVAIRFAGMYANFYLEHGELYLQNGDEALTQTDRDVLFRLAKDVHAAVIAGYKKRCSAAGKSKRSVPSRPQINQTLRTKRPLEKARSTRLYRLYQEADVLQHIAIYSLSAVEARIRFENAEHRFVFTHNVAKHEAGEAWLSREMFAFLCCFTESLMGAVFKGYQSKNPAKQKPAQTAKQLEFSLIQK